MSSAEKNTLSPNIYHVGLYYSYLPPTPMLTNFEFDTQATFQFRTRSKSLDDDLISKANDELFALAGPIEPEIIKRTIANWIEQKDLQVSSGTYYIHPRSLLKTLTL